MKITYNPDGDVLQVLLSEDPIERDTSIGWNINIGFGTTQIVSITILEAAASGHWPIEDLEDLLAQQGPAATGNPADADWHVTPAGGNLFLDLGFGAEEAATLKLTSDKNIEKTHDPADPYKLNEAIFRSAYELSNKSNLIFSFGVWWVIIGTLSIKTQYYSVKFIVGCAMLFVASCILSFLLYRAARRHLNRLR